MSYEISTTRDRPQVPIGNEAGGVASTSHPSPIFLPRLLLKPEIEPILGSLLSALTSPHSDDEISGEIAEMIGFDDIELISEMLVNRATATRELSDFLSEPPVQSHGYLSTNRSQVDTPKNLVTSLNANPAGSLLAQSTRAEESGFLPNVYTSAPQAQGSFLSQFGTKYLLPVETIRDSQDDFDEVIVPPAKPIPPRSSEKLIPVSELDDLARGSFQGYESLNRVQSIVYHTAYNLNENMLVCAPTGAGKTDVAMLTILRVLQQNRTSASGVPLHKAINKSAFKIIYVAPMKALASEIVRKLGKRLQWLSIQVRELTGDMQMTKSEIANTQIIVTTPEKWDVVTRKPTGEGEIVSTLKLLIIDEVHLLNEERGAVIEAIVARTLRQVEFSQTMIRIIGLSATLPNYKDVAEFLKVSPYKGLFYFDTSFRPIPLEQHFIGVRGKPGSLQSKRNLDRVTFRKVADLVSNGHQVMVFVHARKETVKTALGLVEAATAEGILEEFSSADHPQFELFRREIGESRNREMKQLFDKGFGIHHAGMLRTDRNMMEKFFQERAVKVLCTTATLAWGVNLPAHAVIIKGTQVYDSSKGAFADLSVLDVLQVFGRAGRPGLESSGEGYLCTTLDKLEDYLKAVTSQNPIESKFTSGMVDALNAEISLGTVSNVRDAVQWLGYTYWFVRARQKQTSFDKSNEDPHLGSERSELVSLAARKLADAQMILFDRQSGILAAQDIGRIAARYYVRHSSIEIFNQQFRPKMTEADVLAMLSMSTEFDQIQIRESEVKELERLMEVIPCEVKGGTDTSQGKVNILLQGYISRQPVEDFALTSDTAYVAQNGGRIVRALLEIAISRKWAKVTAVLMGLSKSIEMRLWPFEQPLRQFDLKPDIFYGLDRWADRYSVSELISKSAADLGQLVHLNEHHGQAILRAAKQFPMVHVEYNLRPLCFDVLKIAVQVTRSFNWNPKVHGAAESFWLWVEDHEESTILQLWQLAFRQNTDTLHVDFIISIPDGQPPSFVIIRSAFDRWVGAEEEASVSLQDLAMPPASISHTSILDLPFLPVSCLRNKPVQALLADRMSAFNAIQTHILWSLFHSRMHSLVCAPAGCGKSLMGQILMLLTINAAQTQEWILVIVPRHSDAVALIADLQFAQRALNFSIAMATSSTCLLRPKGKMIRVAVATQLCAGIINKSSSIKNSFDGLRLVLCESLQELDAAYEMSVSLLRHATQGYPVRFVGFSTSLNDPADLASWLGVERTALHSFRPQDRGQSLTVTVKTFTTSHSAGLFKAMVKPVHAAIREALEEESAIVFVPSRGQCRSVALDLITQCALERETAKGYLPSRVSDAHLEDYLIRLRDKRLVDMLSRGVGCFHEGMDKADQTRIFQMFEEGIIKVLLVPRESAWKLPVRAGVVVVMGTQYVQKEADENEHHFHDYTLTELVHMQSCAVRQIGAGRFFLFCQAESKEYFVRFLEGGLPLESQLLGSPELEKWYQNMKECDSKERRALETLSFTFLARRMVTNPYYYDTTSEHDETLSRIVDRLERPKTN